LEKVSSKSLFSHWKKALGKQFASQKKVAIHKLYMPQEQISVQPFFSKRFYTSFAFYIPYMVLEIIGETAFALVDLLRMALIAAIPAFVLTLLGQLLFKKIRGKKKKTSWIVAAFAASYIVMLAVIFFLYLFPLYLGFVESDLAKQTPPPEMQLTVVDYGVAFFATIVKNALSAAVLTILLLPMLFFASFVSEKIGEKKKLPALANTFIAVYCTALLAWVIILFVFPWVLSGILYLLFWSQI
jgi:hypothetical protein